MVCFTIPKGNPSQGDKIHCDFTGIKRRCGTTYFGLAAFGLGPPLSLGFYAVGAATASWPGRSRSQPSVLASLSVPRTARRDDSRCPSYQATTGICCITRRVGRRPPDPVPLLPNIRAVLASSNTCRQCENFCRLFSWVSIRYSHYRNRIIFQRSRWISAKPTAGSPGAMNAMRTPQARSVRSFPSRIVPM
jgi:hypothetical protein